MTILRVYGSQESQHLRCVECSQILPLLGKKSYNLQTLLGVVKIKEENIKQNEYYLTNLHLLIYHLLTTSLGTDFQGAFHEKFKGTLILR